MTKRPSTRPPLSLAPSSPPTPSAEPAAVPPRRGASRPGALRPSMSRLSPMLTVADAAGLLSVSSKTVRRLIEREALSAHRIGSGLRISEADLRDYLRGSR